MTYREEFPSFSAYLNALVAAENGIGIDHRLDFAASAGLGSEVPSGGGFLVPEAQTSELHERTYSTGSILQRVGQWPLGAEKMRIPLIDESSRADGSRFGGIAMSWTTPGSEITASKPKFAAREITRMKLSGLVHVTDELLNDAPTLEATFLRLYALEAAAVLEEEILNGNGAGKPLGILNSNAVITVAAESGQAAATLQAANVVNMFSRLWAPSKQRAVWLVNSDIAPQLYGLVWGTGTSVVPLFRWADDGTPTLMGRPVIEHESCSTLGTVGDIILADLGEYMLADPGAVAMDFSEHQKFLLGEGSFRFRLRVDGHPAWQSPITPKNGTATQSPFVALATRA